MLYFSGVFSPNLFFLNIFCCLPWLDSIIWWEDWSCSKCFLAFVRKSLNRTFIGARSRCLQLINQKGWHKSFLNAHLRLIVIVSDPQRQVRINKPWILTVNLVFVSFPHDRRYFIVYRYDNSHNNNSGYKQEEVKLNQRLESILLTPIKNVLIHFQIGKRFMPEKCQTEGHRLIGEGIDTPSLLCSCPGVLQWASFPDDHFIWSCCTMLHCLHPSRRWHFIHCE